MATTPPPLTPFGGTAPQRGDKTTFSSRVDAFVTWLIAVVTQFIAIAANVYANAQEAFVSANTATSAAATAAATANAALWVSGSTIQQYSAVISPADGRTYRRTAATGSGTVDPSVDAQTGTPSYVSLSSLPQSMALLASVTVSSAVANIDFLTLFSSGYDKYVIEAQGLTPSVADQLLIRLAKAGAADSAGVYYNSTVGGGSTTSSITMGLSAPSCTKATMTICVRDANNALDPKSIEAMGFSVAGSLYPANYETIYNSANVVTGFRLYWFGGSNFTKGTIRIYGIKNT